jgi:DNA-binding GntR family transcriptional regulator
MQSIHRSNISGEVAQQIRDMIANGTLPAESRINEVHLSQELGVSRTPLREALATLVSEGALENRPRKGNFVRPLTREEFESIYAIRPILDVQALKLSGIPEPEDLDRLERLNEKMREAKNARARISRDDDWHLLLVQNCGNQVLLDLIRQFIFRTRRYEIAYLRNSNNASTAYDEHRAIIHALRKRDLSGACRALKQNLTSGVSPIIDWLQSMEKQS